MNNGLYFPLPLQSGIFICQALISTASYCIYPQPSLASMPPRKATKTAIERQDQANSTIAPVPLTCDAKPSSLSSVFARASQLDISDTQSQLRPSRKQRILTSVTSHLSSCLKFPRSYVKTLNTPLTSPSTASLPNSGQESPATIAERISAITYHRHHLRTIKEAEKRFQKLCRLEHRGKLSSDVRCCSALSCQTVHKIPLFSEGQLKRPAEKRRCNGAEYVLDVCSHLQMQWDDVQSSLARENGAGWCHRGIHGLLPPLSSKDEDRDVLMFRQDGPLGNGVVVLRKQLVLARLPKDIKRYPKRLIKGRLEQLGQNICPHVSLGFESWDFLTGECGVHSQYGTMGEQEDDNRVMAGDENQNATCKALATLDTRRFWSSWCLCCDFSHGCPVQSCETEWRVVRRIGEEEDEIVLDVVRWLGRMEEGEGKENEGITGFRWLGQIKEEENEPLKAWRIIERLEERGMKWRV